MKSVLLALALLFFFPTSASAIYEITDFEVKIEILQDTTIRVEDKISVDFLTPHHGIFRDIPEKLKVVWVSDPYTVSDHTQIKIGDPNKTITGPKIYTIIYEVKDQIKQFDAYDELYWNVTGSEWEVEIPHNSVTIVSDFADIDRIECFAGIVGGQDRDCVVENSTVRTSVPVGQGSDFTIVIGLARPNQLQFPGLLEKYWWVVLVFLPSILAGIAWYRRGRDDRYLSDNVYIKPEDGKTKTVSMFDRPHLPNQYHPIAGLTPAEAGTIIDQKVDLADVVAEITELARLGYLHIHQFTHKKLLRDKVDYLFIRTSKVPTNLKAHQAQLLLAITNKTYWASPETVEKILGSKEAIRVAKHTFQLSKMENKFYTDLNRFKDSLYSDLSARQIFDGRPDRVKSGWLIGVFVFQFVTTQVLAVFSPIAFPLGIVSGIIALVFAYHMPRRTAWGYSLHRQLTGLQFFVGKGKWRYEIAEKRLFLEEILPLAISLGVVNQLASDMQGLSIQPEYMGNVSVSHFSHFQSTLGSTISSYPSKSSGGGSGFGGGGSSGGGGGGGGGGGW